MNLLHESDFYDVTIQMGKLPTKQNEQTKIRSFCFLSTFNIKKVRPEEEEIHMNTISKKKSVFDANYFFLFFFLFIFAK